VATNPDRASYFPAIEKRYGQPMSYWFDHMREIEGGTYAEQVTDLRDNHGFSQAHANALVLYCRGNTTSRRFESVDDYLAPHGDTKRATVRAILDAIGSEYPEAEVVIAWNKPMVRVDGTYVLGISVHSAHLLLLPTSAEVIDRLRGRLDGYQVKTKSVRVPVDWEVDAALLRDLVAVRLAQVAAS
jgi:uncharacterized protein YdhG (YjbR/CyaY superfamily)